MKRNKLFPMAGLACLLLAGCEIYSPLALQPLFDDDILLFNPTLLGTWQEEGRTTKVRFEVYEDSKVYRIKVLDEEPVLAFEGRLGQIGGWNFLDLRLEEAADCQIPGHFFCRLEIDGDVLRMYGVKENWLRERVVEQGLLPYVRAGKVDRGRLVVITASPIDLQLFFVRYGGDPEAYDSVQEFHRVRE